MRSKASCTPNSRMVRASREKEKVKLSERKPDVSAMEQYMSLTMASEPCCHIVASEPRRGIGVCGWWVYWFY